MKFCTLIDFMTFYKFATHYVSKQIWPPFGHFESSDLVFWRVSRYGSLTHVHHISAPYLLRLRKLPARYVKKCDLGIQNGHQAAILDPTYQIVCVQVGPMGILDGLPTQFKRLLNIFVGLFCYKQPTNV